MNNQKLQEGIVLWFDNRSGEGMIRDSAGNSIYVHYSAIDVGYNIHSKDVWRVLFFGQKVSIKILRDYTFTQISYVGAPSPGSYK